MTNYKLAERAALRLSAMFHIALTGAAIYP